MTIALDIMSGDCSPCSRIEAACAALLRYPQLHLVLIGDAELIRSQLGTGISLSRPLGDGITDLSDRITIIHASQAVTMAERPSHALRRKQDSSMWLAIEHVALGIAQACVSAGNTGALMVMGRHLLKTFPGIDRPALVSFIPTALSGTRSGGESRALVHKSSPVPAGTLLLDLGANVDCSAEQLCQFAALGSAMQSEVYDVESPRVGLLNVGAEDVKGSATVRLAHQLIESHDGINYCGFVEGNDLYSGRVDVVVCDGFAGNVALKASEAAVRMVADRIRTGAGLKRWQQLLLKLSLPFLKPAVRQIDPGRFNGATLLGLQGIVVKSHGAADSRQFGYAIDQAVRAAEHNATDRINERLEQLL